MRCYFLVKERIFMNITDFKASLAQFIGTMYYHKLSLFPVLATDGVKYFCEKASAFWLFDDMSAVTVTKAKNEEFIVAAATSKDNECDVVYDDGNKNKIYEQHYDYTDLPEGEWKFYISNYPTQKVIMLPSEY